MSIAYVIVSGLFAALLLVSALGKARKDPAQMATLQTVAFPQDRVWLLAVAEVAGAAGLVAGWFWAPLGLAAGIGTVAYFLGALGSHLRVRDSHLQAAAVLLLVAVGTVILRALSL